MKVNNNKPNYKYEFDRKRSRVKKCPCGKSNQDGKFVPFVGFDKKGFCHSCGTTFLNDSVALMQNNRVLQKEIKISTTPPNHQFDIIPRDLYLKQLNLGKHLYGRNNFILYLGNKKRGTSAFSNSTIKELIMKYLIGNSTLMKYRGWVLFPYIDIRGQIREVKAMNYNPETGKRIQTPVAEVKFIGKELLNDWDANLHRCFYGENLLKGNEKPVMIFESEATATYATPFYPQFNCLATGGKNGIRWMCQEISEVLRGHQVILYPDIDAYSEWENHAELLRCHGIQATVSQLIKVKALNFAQKHKIEYSELCRYKFDLRDFLQHTNLYDFKLLDKIVSMHEAVG